MTTRATNSVLINPFQDLVDGGAAYVHEMAHIAGKDETDARLVEIDFYIEISVVLKQNVVFKDYIDYQVVMYKAATNSYEVNKDNLKKYIAHTGTPPTFTPRRIPPMYAYPWAPPVIGF